MILTEMMCITYVTDAATRKGFGRAQRPIHGLITVDLKQLSIMTG